MTIRQYNYRLPEHPPPQPHKPEHLKHIRQDFKRVQDYFNQNYRCEDLNRECLVIYSINYKKYAVMYLEEKGYPGFYLASKTALKEEFMRYFKVSLTKGILENIPSREFYFRPDKPFGDLSNNQFNFCFHGPSIRVINKDMDVANKVEKPEIFLDFFYTLVNNKDRADYMLRFLKTKFTTFEHSKVVPIFKGPAGAGRGVFLKVLYKLADRKLCSPITEKERTGSDDCIVDMFFTTLEHIDSYPAYSAVARKYKKWILKTMNSENPREIKCQRIPVYTDNLYTTVMVVVNQKPFIIESGDPNFLILESKCPLIESDWAKKAKCMVEKIELMQSEPEVMKLAYYLRDHVKPLSSDEYREVPEKFRVQ